MIPDGSLEVEYLDGKVEVYPYSSMSERGWWTEGLMMNGDVRISIREPAGRIIIPRSVVRKLRLVYNSGEYSDWARRQRMVDSQGLDGSVAFPDHPSLGSMSGSSSSGHDFRAELERQGFGVGGHERGTGHGQH